jgi:anti-sigma B factor antagonist
VVERDRGPAELVHVTVSRHQDRADAEVVGELDMSNAEAVYLELLAATESLSQLRVDLSGLTFIDSTGLSSLDRLARTLSAQGCHLTYLTAPDGAVSRILHLTGMDQVLPMAGDPDA